MVTRAALVLGVALAVILSGCAQQDPAPMPLPSQTPSATPTALDPNSTEARKISFDETNVATIAAANGGNPGGRAFIDALVAAGFDKTAMELTPDETAIGLAADNIQFSVRLDEDCLVGQYGNVGYQSSVLPVLGTGACLVGTTRAIDW